MAAGTGVHGRDHPEAGGGGDVAQAGHVQLPLAHGGDDDVERLLRHPVDLLDVEEGAGAQGLDQRAVEEHFGGVALDEHPGRVERADQPRRGQLGVALHEDQLDAGRGGEGPQQGRLAGARWPLEQHVAVGGERRHHHLDLGPTPDDGPVRDMSRRRRS